MDEDPDVALHGTRWPIHEMVGLLRPLWRIQSGQDIDRGDLYVDGGDLVFRPTGDRIPYPQDWRSDQCYPAILALAERVRGQETS
jgi:hypothetical protein